MAGRKAITTVIAVLLVAAITIAVALSAFTFLQKTQRSAQGITESSTSNLLQRFSTCGKLVSFTFNPVTNMSEAVMRNCGFRDIDLENENLQVIIKTQAGSCIFRLNSTNCRNCVGKLSVGAFVAFQINTSEVYCASTLADLLSASVGQNVEVVIGDKAASFSTATTFVPEPIVQCVINITRVGLGSVPASGDCIPDIFTQNFCQNYTIANLGNAPDIFALTAIQQFGGLTKIHDGSDCNGSNLSSVALEPNASKNLSVRYTCTSPKSGLILTAQSENCASTQDSTKVIVGTPACTGSCT